MDSDVLVAQKEVLLKALSKACATPRARSTASPPLRARRSINLNKIGANDVARCTW